MQAQIHNPGTIGHVESANVLESAIKNVLAKHYGYGKKSEFENGKSWAQRESCYWVLKNDWRNRRVR